MNDYYLLLLNKNNFDLHSIKSSATNYNITLIIKSYLHYNYINIDNYFLDINN